MDRIRLAQRLVRTALAFHAAAPWRRFTGKEVVAIHLAGEPTPVFVSILGEPGDDPGLLLFRGSSAFTHCQCLVAGGDPANLNPAPESLLVLFVAPSEVPADRAALLRDAKFSGSVAPWCERRRPTHHPRATTTAENSLLVAVFAGIVAADAQGLLRPVAPATSGSAAVWTLTLSGKASKPEVRAKFEQYTPDSPVPEAGPVALPDDIAGLPGTGARWWVAVPELPIRIENDDRVVRMILVYDDDQDALLSMAKAMRIDPLAVAKEFFAVCRGDNSKKVCGLPAHVDFDRVDLHDALAPALAQVGVTTACVRELPQADDVAEIIALDMRRWAGHDVDREPEERDDTGEPDALDHEGWRRIDVELTARLRELGAELDSLAEGEERFFGPEPDVPEHADNLSEASFGEWLACHWRPDQHGHTAAELLLAENSLPAASQRLLAARSAAPVGLWRTAAVMPGEGIDLVDVLEGTTVRVHDHGLADILQADVVFFAKVYPAGGFSFMWVMSPMLVLDAHASLLWLESQGMEFTPTGITRSSFLLGRMWTWKSERSRRAVPFTDASGEALRDIRASYRVAHEASVRRQLAQRGDVLEHEGKLYWVRKDGGGSIAETLGTLEFFGGELVAEAWTEAKFAAMQEWLRRLRFVRELGVSRGDFLDQAVDDQLGGPTRPARQWTEELAGSEVEMRRTWSTAWLDEPLPELGGSSPRRAIATVEGRRKVLRMIRVLATSVPSGGPNGERVSRNDLLRELGLPPEDPEQAAGQATG